MERTLAILGLSSLFLTLPGGASPAVAQDYKVVAHPDVPAGSLTRDQLSRLFMKKTTEWADGTAVVPVDQDSASRPREAFSQDVHGKDTRAVVAFWQKRVFSGRGMPPLIRANDALVLDYVRTTPGAVGYVSAGAPADGLKVIRVE